MYLDPKQWQDITTFSRQLHLYLAVPPVVGLFCGGGVDGLLLLWRHLVHNPEIHLLRAATRHRPLRRRSLRDGRSGGFLLATAAWYYLVLAGWHRPLLYTGGGRVLYPHLAKEKKKNMRKHDYGTFYLRTEILIFIYVLFSPVVKTINQWLGLGSHDPGKISEI